MDMLFFGIVGITLEIRLLRDKREVKLVSCTMKSFENTVEVQCKIYINNSL